MRSVEVKETCCCGATFTTASEYYSDIRDAHFSWQNYHEVCRKAKASKIEKKPLLRGKS